MKQGDYVGWVFGTKHHGKDDIVAKGTILKKMPNGTYKVLLFRTRLVRYFRKSELRVIQAAE